MADLSGFMSLIMLVVNIHRFIALDSGENSICDKYILLSLNRTMNTQLKMVEKSAPMILSHGFNSDILKHSRCVEITSCALPGTLPHQELVMTMKTQRSLNWKLKSCQENYLNGYLTTKNSRPGKKFSSLYVNA